MNITFRNRAITRGNELTLEAIANDGKTIAAVRGLSGKRINQVLRTIGIATTPTVGLVTVPVAFLNNLPVSGDIEFIPKGNKYQYTAEDIERFKNDNITVQGHTTKACSDDLEQVVAGKDYYSPEDMFRVNDVRSIVIEPTDNILKLLVTREPVSAINVPKAASADFDITV